MFKFLGLVFVILVTIETLINLGYVVIVPLFIVLFIWCLYEVLR